MEKFNTAIKTTISFTAFAFVVFLTIIFLLVFIASISPIFAKSDKTTFISKFFVLKTAVYTIKIAFFSTLIAVLIGLPTAYFIANKDFFGKKLLESLSVIPFCFPPLLVALGYVSTFGINGIVSRTISCALGLEKNSIIFLYSQWGIVFVQGFYNFPLIMKSVSDSWRTVEKQQENSARILGASEFCIFRTITFYKILPALASSAMVVFLFCFFSFIIVLLFGSAKSITLEVAIYQVARSTLNFNLASKLALIETSLAILAIIFYSFLEQKSFRQSSVFVEKKSTEWIENQKYFSKKHELFLKIAFFALMTTVIICLILPLFMIMFNAFFYSTKNSFLLSTFLQGVKNFKNLFLEKAFYNSVINTIKTASLTSFICTIAGTSFALVLKHFANGKSLKKSFIFKIAPMITLSVSSVVIGIGFTLLVRRGSPILLVIAQSTLFWPYAFRQIVHSVEKIPNGLIESATLLCANPVQKYFSIILPLCKKSIISAFGLCFAMSAGDTTLPLVLAIPRYDTLALFTYRLVGSYQFAKASESGCILAILTVGVFILSSKIMKE